MSSKSDSIYIIGYGTFIIKALGRHPFQFEVQDLIGEVKVEGYRRVFDPAAWFPWVILSSKHFFYGLLFTISKSELKNLDRIESEGYLYDRVTVKIKHKDSLYQAFIYVASKLSVASVEILQLATKMDFPDYWPAYLRNEVINNHIPKSQMDNYPHLFQGPDFPENFP